jgi:hypothetical protein
MSTSAGVEAVIAAVIDRERTSRYTVEDAEVLSREALGREAVASVRAIIRRGMMMALTGSTSEATMFQPRVEGRPHSAEQASSALMLARLARLSGRTGNIDAAAEPPAQRVSGPAPSPPKGAPLVASGRTASPARRFASPSENLERELAFARLLQRDGQDAQVAKSLSAQERLAHGGVVGRLRSIQRLPRSH